MEAHTVCGDATLYHGDSRDVLKTLADNSIDSVVCDPPYALVSIVKRFGKPGSAPVNNAGTKAGNTGDPYARAAAGFMGKQWDTGETAFAVEFWAEVMRTLKPGGHVVAFSGTRTYHRLACAIEDAGFEIRDQLAWVYGSGFPKSHDVSKGIDKAAGAERAATATRKIAIDQWTEEGRKRLAAGEGGMYEIPVTAPATEAARQWQGWGTALKPAWEPIVLARKPLIGTVAENVLAWGVGALNIDGCRVGSEGGTAFGRSADKSETASVGGYLNAKAGSPIDAGRWPANIVHDGSDEVLAGFPTSKDGVAGKRGGENGNVLKSGLGSTDKQWGGFGGQGTAARFFYCAKASRADRDAGLEGFAKKPGGMVSNTSGQHITRRDEGYEPTPRANTHPTVKPTELMQWLCRMVTPRGGVVLDPFMGSGSTGRGALREGCKFIGIEREEEYMPIAAARIADALKPEKKARPKKKTHANDNAPRDLFGEVA